MKKLVAVDGRQLRKWWWWWWWESAA